MRHRMRGTFHHFRARELAFPSPPPSVFDRLVLCFLSVFFFFLARSSMLKVSSLPSFSRVPGRARSFATAKANSPKTYKFEIEVSIIHIFFFSIYVTVFGCARSAIFNNSFHSALLRHIYLPIAFLLRPKPPLRRCSGSISSCSACVAWRLLPISSTRVKKFEAFAIFTTVRLVSQSIDYGIFLLCLILLTRSS